MIKNYFITAVRNIRRNKGYSFINIAGLAVGMTFFLLILLYVSFELSYDDYHENYERIYRVVQKQPGNVFIGSDIWAITQGILAPTMMDEIPDVMYATRIDRHRGLISNDNLSFYETGITTDNQFFDIFSFELLSGNPKMALNDPYSIILSEKLAEKYFGKENPIGKTVTLNNRHILTVTGIHKYVPQNSHFKFDFILSIKLRETEAARRQNIYDWSSSNYHTYFGKNGF
jgi:putative ABC transport system permease protein